MAEDDNISKPRKQTLLQKFDMLVDCLSFEHVENCNNVKELEKIVKILRSGEEGNYPQLQAAAEDKLSKLQPNNRLLRVDQPVLAISALSADQRRQVVSDMEEWAGEMQQREIQLKNSDSVQSREYPAVRNAPAPCVVTDLKNKVNKATATSASGKREVKPHKCLPNDYTFWDKFDADKEVLKMDLEEERLADKKEAEQRRRKELKQQELQKEKIEEKTLDEAAVRAGDGTSLAEKAIRALEEKTKGNECFHENDFKSALLYYTRSIALFPTVEAYNNRAQTHLKLGNYSKAVEDCNNVLSLDPRNVKGFYRRGIAWFHQRNFCNALGDFEKALEINPNNRDCQDFANKARSSLGVSASSKRVRMAIHDADSNGAPKIQEVDNKMETKDRYYPFFNPNPNDDIVLNAIGTAKVMCRCSGTPGFMTKVRSLDDIKEHGRLSLRRGTRSKKRDASNCDGKQSSIDEKNVTPDNKTVNGNGPSTLTAISSKKNKMLEEKDVKQSNAKCEPNSAGNLPGMWASAHKDFTANMENLNSPYYFSAFWSSIKGMEDLATVAKALNILQPEQMTQVVGNKLDEGMLSLFIQALRKHFSLPADWGLVQRYLHSFTQLPRFGIVHMMLDTQTKKEVESLLNEAEGQGLRVSDLFKLYGLTHCTGS